MKELHDKVIDEAIKKVEESKKTEIPSNTLPTKKKAFSMQRTNPTIAAMEIMTRKENAQNAMEERMLRYITNALVDYFDKNALLEALSRQFCTERVKATTILG